MNTDKKTHYHEETPQAVRDILDAAMHTDQRLKLYYGDRETGRDYCEEYDTIGTIGRSNGSRSIPLLIKTTRSIGGGAILDHCIIKIRDTKTGQVLYQHPKYQAPTVKIKEGSNLPGYTHETHVNGKLHGRHKSLKSAQICKAKIQ